jgi:hypothetical protein
VLLLRLNYENNGIIDDSDNYHIVQHLSKITQIDLPNNEGWQLRFVLASIYTSCSHREFQRTHTFRDNKEINDLLIFSGGVPSIDHFELGIGFVARKKG